MQRCQAGSWSGISGSCCGPVRGQQLCLVSLHLLALPNIAAFLCLPLIVFSCSRATCYRRLGPLYSSSVSVGLSGEDCVVSNCIQCHTPPAPSSTSHPPPRSHSPSGALFFVLIANCSVWSPRRWPTNAAWTGHWARRHYILTTSCRYSLTVARLTRMTSSYCCLTSRLILKPSVHLHIRYFIVSYHVDQ